MSPRRTPPLSRKGTQEVLEEMKRPPADTPERRATFELVDEMEKHIDHATRRKHSSGEW